MRPVRILEAVVAAWRRRKWSHLSPGQQSIRQVINQISLEERAELKRELDEGIRESTAYLRRTAHEHEAAQKAIAEERERRAPEVQAAHAARMKAMAEGVEASDGRADKLGPPRHQSTK